MRAYRIFFLVVISQLFATSTFASIQKFRLFDHPNGGAADPTYGLRLDNLLSMDGEYTFSFDQPNAAMFLEYDSTAETIRIFGQAFGGLDIGSVWDPDYATLWDIDFTYTANVSLDTDGNGDDFVVNPDNPNNSGTITAAIVTSATSAINQGDSYSLVDFNGDPSKGFSFKFNDIDQHRIDAGPDNDGRFVGWGWVNHSDEPHVAASDWLFTGIAIPEPTTFAVPEPTTFIVWSLLGLTSSGIVYRRKRTA